MNAVIDQGNTTTKVYIFNRNVVEYFQKYATPNFSIKKVLPTFLENKVTKCICTSVAQDEIKGLELLAEYNIYLIEYKHTTSIPIENLYETPETLGLDRLAAVIGANNIYASSNVLVIDAGTAITFDFINSQGQYLGGNISPGLELRFKALHHFTGKLPMLAPDDVFHLLGKTTKSAIISGVQQGVIYEIDGYIDNLRMKYSDLKVFLTGGDAIFFEKKLKNIIFAEPNLVAIGLNRILNYNE